MPRKLDPDTRHRVMASIRKANTTPERILRAALRSYGLAGYRCNLSSVYGTPDVAFTRWRLAVFVDGVWWHGHPRWLPRGRRGPYWDAKIARNVQRDREVDVQLRSRGWYVLRLWDIDVLADPAASARQVADALTAVRLVTGEVSRDQLT